MPGTGADSSARWRVTSTEWSSAATSTPAARVSPTLSSFPTPISGPNGPSAMPPWDNRPWSCSRPLSTTPRTWARLEWFVDEVAPRLRTRLPDVEVRLVGTPVPGVQSHHRPPAITVVGVVPAMEPELARADIAVVPLRYGSGTRLKILESFAHRIPVVSTTIGAEGLQVVHGVHLLLADDPEAFAAACAQLLTDPDLRGHLVDAAENLYLQRYERSAARDRIKALVREVAGDNRAHS